MATVLRPDNLKDFFGQEKVIGKGTWLRTTIEKDQVTSLIFWGPPGVGKTTLAFIIAKETKAEFKSLSAVDSGLKDLREIIKQAEIDKRLGHRTVLFIDEIHRWNKAQQDALLPYIENGLLILIGATTENPSFSINSALLSRLKVVVLENLDDQAINSIIKRGSKKLKLKIDNKNIKLITKLSSGDARRSLNILEDIYTSDQEISIDLIKNIANKPQLNYDKKGEEHYNLISALHKSMRGGNAQAALYWLARMIESGEDPLFIARRMIRFASEDIGLANNSALMLMTAVYDACAKIGLPECNVVLAHGVVYLSKSKKSIAVYKAYNYTIEEINESGSLPVPLHLRNASTKLMKDLDYGKDYKYSPEVDDSSQTYLPKGLRNKNFKKLSNL
ncbi:MAG: replication-associated recombination protein A [Bacilli bacterium]|nr:replication-associated recombination protein A [Bacilli bacterium]